MGTRLSDLGDRLTELRQRTNPLAESVNARRALPEAAVRFAFRSGIGILTTVLCGCGFGWLVDYWLKTTPLFLILFFFLGAGAGLYNIFLAARALQR